MFDTFGSSVNEEELMRPQTYRGYIIRHIYRDGYAIERPDGAHWASAESYQHAIKVIDLAEGAAVFNSVSEIVNACAYDNVTWNAEYRHYQDSRNRFANEHGDGVGYESR